MNERTEEDVDVGRGYGGDDGGMRGSWDAGAESRSKPLQSRWQRGEEVVAAMSEMVMKGSFEYRVEMCYYFIIIRSQQPKRQCNAKTIGDEDDDGGVVGVDVDDEEGWNYM